MRIGLQIPAFNFPGGTPAIAPTLAQIAQTADQAGFDSLWLMDHFFQFQPLGPADDPMLEAYTTLAYLAALTRRVRLGVLVSGVVYRYPAVLVKTVSTLDVLSGGRAYLGLGAAWYEREARGLGLPFPGWSQRLVTLKKIESGERRPSRQMALRLAECLGIPSAVSNS